MRDFLCSAGFVVLLGALSGTACKGNVGLDVTLPSGVSEKALWVEVGAFEGGHCDGLLPMLKDGIPDGATARLAFKKDDGGPQFGNLPNGKYAMAAVARGADCTVLAYGCNDEDLGSTSHVVIALDAASGDATGKCAAGATCQAAKCIPANDNADPSVGAGCSLELIGAGPLAKPAGAGNTEISAPAIAATDTGFLIAYREVDPNGGGARITLLPIDAAGGALTPQRPPLPNPCSTADQSDGVGLVVNGASAMMALAKPPCGEKPELQLLNLTLASGQVNVGKFFVSASPNGDAVNLGAARASANVGGQNLVVFAEGGEGRIAHMDPGKGIVGPNGSFGATTGVTNTWMAGNDTIMALVAAVGPSTGTPTTLPDGGPISSDPATPAPTDDTSSTDSNLALLLLPANTATDAISAEQSAPRPPVTFPGKWASVATIAGRVIVMSDGSGPGRQVSYRAFDQSKDDPLDTGGFSLAGDGTVTTGDVVVLGDRAYFAALEPAGVALHVFANATTRLTPLRDVSFAQEPRISAINTVRDGGVAVAATSTRVAVVWTTAKALDSGPGAKAGNDKAGGYAVFACTQ